MVVRDLITFVQVIVGFICTRAVLRVEMYSDIVYYVFPDVALM